MRPILVAAIAATLGVGACGEPPEPAPAPDSEPAATTPAPAEPVADDEPADSGEQGGTDDWRDVADRLDEERVNTLDRAWETALGRIEGTEYERQVETAGVELDEDAGLSGRIQPPPGLYDCRSHKLGSPNGGLPYVTYPPYACEVELTPGGDLILTKLTGSQRTRGLIYPDNDARGVYIGAQAWGDERGYPAYGQMEDRDQIGVVERIGENVWRILFPWPRQESELDVLVLTR